VSPGVPLNAFLVARGLLDRASSAADQTAPGSIASVVLCDLAVETAAKATLGTLGQPSDFPGRGYFIPTGELRKPSIKDDRLAFALDRLLAHHRLNVGDSGADIAGRSSARQLREYRNGVQHDGNVPSSDDINRSRFRALEFLDGVLGCFYGLTLGQVSRASLIWDDQIAALITDAEDAAERGDLEDAGKCLGAAFGLARMGFRSGEPYERPFRVSANQVRSAVEGIAPPPRASGTAKSTLQRLFNKGLGMTSSDAQAVAKRIFPDKADGGKAFAAVLDGLVRETGRISDRIDAFSAAGDPGEFAWFRRRIPEAAFFWGSDQMEWRAVAPDPPLDRAEFLRAMDFVVSTALRWQEAPPEESDESQSTTDTDAES
jgi:hypothetical protein